MSKKSLVSKKSTVARLILLPLIVSVLLSACHTEPYDNDSESSLSSQTVISDTSESQSGTNSEEFFESSDDTSFVNSSEESSIAEEESSEAQLDVSNEESSGEETSEETSEKEPTIKRSSLTPVLELDIGLEEGDYELAIGSINEGYPQAPSEFFVRGNEILIYDYGNRRLLLYRDGNLVDRVKVEEELSNINGMSYERLIAFCAFDEKFYYMFQPSSGVLLSIDRTTKEFTHMKPRVEDIIWGYYYGMIYYDFILDNSEIYLVTYGALGERCFRVDGKTVAEAENPLGCTLDPNERNPQLLFGDEKIPIQRSPEWERNGRLECRINGDRYLIYCKHHTEFLKPNGYGRYFKTFYRYDALGNLTGRYLWKKNFLTHSHGYTVGDDGELYVIALDVNMRDPSKGKLFINRVEFGFDEPFKEGKDYEADVPIELPPPENPSKLTPVIELGAGDGDYEVKFIHNMYGLDQSTIELAVYKNEAAIFDFLNSRVLVYSDGKLIDKIDISAFIDCEDTSFYDIISERLYGKFDDKYYYTLYENRLFVIDRATKEHTALSVIEDDGYSKYYYFELILSGGDVYLEERIYTIIDSYNRTLETSYFILDGATLSECDNPRRFTIRQDGRKNYLLADGKEVELEYSPDWDFDYRLDGVGMSGDGLYVVSSMILPYTHDWGMTKKTHRIFYKYNSEGKLVGRYVWEMPYFSSTSGHGYTFDENGEFYIIRYPNIESDATETDFGVYKIDFGMDHPCHPKEYLLK